eukprot:5186339-Prymnesium_polylepis.1
MLKGLKASSARKSDPSQRSGRLMAARSSLGLPLDSASTPAVSPVGNAEKKGDAMHVDWCQPGEAVARLGHRVRSNSPRDVSSAQRKVGAAFVPRYTISWSPSIDKRSWFSKSYTRSTVPAGTSVVAVYGMWYSCAIEASSSPHLAASLKAFGVISVRQPARTAGGHRVRTKARQWRPIFVGCGSDSAP